jgi:hypothetical protein
MTSSKPAVAAKPAAPAKALSQFKDADNVDYYGYDIKMLDTKDPETCAKACIDTPNCNLFVTSTDSNECWLKTELGPRQPQIKNRNTYVKNSYVAAPVVSAPVVSAPVVAAPVVAAPVVSAPVVAAPVVAAPVVAAAAPVVTAPVVTAPVVAAPVGATATVVTAPVVQLSSPLKFVRIVRTAQSPGGLSLNINEIQAYDASNNLIPFTISMYGPDGDNADGLAGFPARNAVDGNLNNFAHTNEAMKSFLQVGLASETPIAKLVVYPRPANKNRMLGTRVEFYNGNGQEAAPSININEEKDVYTFQFRSSGGASSWLASRINHPQYLRHLQNKNYLSYTV